MPKADKIKVLLEYKCPNTGETQNVVEEWSSVDIHDYDYYTKRTIYVTTECRSCYETHNVYIEET